VSPAPAFGRWLLVLLFVFDVPACTSSSAVPARAVLRLTTGTPGGGFHPLGDALAAAYRKGLPSAELIVRESAGSIANVEAIQAREADAGFAFADVAYAAYAGRLAGRSSRFDELRGIAVLQLTPLHLVAGPASGIHSVADLRGRRVAIGLSGSGSALTADLVLRSFDLDPTAVQLQSLAYNDASAALVRGTVDAMFVVGSVPLESVSRALQGGAALVAIDSAAIDRLRHRYPFFRRAIIPPGAYGEARSIATIGVENVLVCSRQLDESLVYAMTRQLFESLPALALQFPSLRTLDLEASPATPIPLHDGAARYYREQELAR
jgi:TRAP transporter TAXI family solute receptor